MSALVEDLLAGDHRALARVISNIEDRTDGYRDIVAQLYRHTGHADVIGITGSPGAGKSTLVDKMAAAYREQGLTVGVIAIDPSSPFTGGAVLGDRIRMASNAGDMDVFFRSMSTRGTLGGLSTATTDAVKALDAFGKDKIIVETVGAGQNEIDVVKTADTVAVLVPPDSGDDVQMLKAGILEIADVFVVNKADLDGADRTVQALREMLQEATAKGHHGQGPVGTADGGRGTAESGNRDFDPWKPPIVETVAARSEGVEEFLETLEDHADYLDASGQREAIARKRTAEEIRTLLRQDIGRLARQEIERQGGIDAFVDAVLAQQTDPYSVVDDLLDPFEACLDEQRE